MSTPDSTSYPVDSTTRPCCQGIGNHTPGCTRCTRVPLPPGAGADEWEDKAFPNPWRPIYGLERPITDHDVCVQARAIQECSGDLDEVRVEVGDGLDLWFNGDQARELAAALMEAADEVDGWAQR